MDPSCALKWIWIYFGNFRVLVTFRKQNAFPLHWDSTWWRIFLFEFVRMRIFIQNEAVSRVYGHWPWSSPCHNRDGIIIFFKAIHCHVICNKPRFSRFYRIPYPNMTHSWLSQPLVLDSFNFSLKSSGLFYYIKIAFLYENYLYVPCYV